MIRTYVAALGIALIIVGFAVAVQLMVDSASATVPHAWCLQLAPSPLP